MEASRQQTYLRYTDMNSAFKRQHTYLRYTDMNSAFKRQHTYLHLTYLYFSLVFQRCSEQSNTKQMYI